MPALPLLTVCAAIPDTHNSCLLAALLYTAASLGRTTTLSTARTGALLSGLALSNQHAALLTVAPLMCAAVCWLASSKLLTVQSLLVLAVWFCAGLLPYAYLPLTAHVRFTEVNLLDNMGEAIAVHRGAVHGLLCMRHYEKYAYVGLVCVACGELCAHAIRSSLYVCDLYETAQ
jgi:hypothetical protein